jgi:hypothetical protein
MPWSTAIAVLILLCWLAAAAEMLRGLHRMKRLARLAPPVPARWPRVSLVFAARNEGRTVAAAAQTMLGLDYPNLELIAVNDRSEDDTGGVLDQLAARDARLRVDHVRELPAGWIGKNHALHHGAARATGEWILFTDADIHFAPDALRRAVAHAVAQSLDHLAAVPRLHNHRHWLGIGVNGFSFLFTLGIQPWRISDPRSRAHGGVGAFNLVRASTYRKLGGHEPLRMRPDDDLKLGKLMKAGGFSEFVLGADAISVDWYPSMRAMVQGLAKNAYAGADYRPWVPPLGAAIVLAGFVWPVAALFLTAGPARWLYAASVAVMLLLGCNQTRFTGGRWWHGLFLPVGVAVFGFILLRSQIVTHWTRGITWRGTHYPLHELKANRL